MSARCVKADEMPTVEIVAGAANLTPGPLSEYAYIEAAMMSRYISSLRLGSIEAAQLSRTV